MDIVTFTIYYTNKIKSIYIFCTSALPEDGYKKLQKDVGCSVLCMWTGEIHCKISCKQNFLYIFTKIEKNEMDWACGAYG